mgnify:FL=1
MKGEAPTPLDPSFRIELPFFDGPLDLLLHLIQKHELEIGNLPVAFVTERYLEYITLMKRLDLDIAAEYLVMASTLVYIKSRSLLPAPPADEGGAGDEDEGVDPKAELIRKLLEYQKYKAAAENLDQRELLGRDVLLRPASSEGYEVAPPELESVSVFRLLDVLQVVFARLEGRKAFEISAERITIQERMTQLTERLLRQRRCRFSALFDDAQSVYEVVVSFLAVLEMVKGGSLRIKEEEDAGDLILESAFSSDDAQEGDAEGAVDEAGDASNPRASES